MKKLRITTLPLICAAAAPLCADAQGTQMGNKPTDQQMYMQEMNKITPSAEPSVTRYADPFITADFIWWKVQEDGLEYAFNGVTTANGNPDSGKMHHPHFEYEPGFKVGAGLKFRHDGWDLFAQYTWLQFEKGDSKSSVHADSDDDSFVQNNIAFPFNGFNPISGFWREAEADWSLHFNVLDLELGRNFWISKWLTLRPFVGMKFSWLDQDFDVEYENGITATFDRVKMDMDLDQTAVGLRSGINTAFYMWKKWSIYGDFAINGLWNDFDASRKDSFVFPGSAIEVTNNKIKRDSHAVTAVIEWALGLRFETAFHNDDFMFMLQAGWEEQIWFNQNQFIISPVMAQTSTDLNFEGLTIKAGFYF